jgi:hypothetical protein
MDAPEPPADEPPTTDPTPGYPPPDHPRPPGRGFTVAGFVFAGIALVLGIPILMGPIGVALGVTGMRKGDPLGRSAILAAVLGMVARIVLNAIIVTGGDEETLALLLR